MSITSSKESPFNQLTPAQLERLALLTEELGEALQATGKVLRFGYSSRHPKGGLTNKESLELELGHVRHAIIRLCASEDLSKQGIHLSADIKAATIGVYLKHQ